MTEPRDTLERSLRDGPPDEVGYRSQPLELDLGRGAWSKTGMTPLHRVVPVRGPRHRRPIALGMPIAATLVIAVGVTGLAILTRHSPSVIVQPAASAATSPSPSPSPATSPSPERSPASATPPPAAAISLPIPAETFISPRNGFSVRYPTGWTVTPASASWLPDTFLPIGNPALDELKRDGEARLVVASQPLAAGQTEEQWLAGYFPPYRAGLPCLADSRAAIAGSPRLPIGGRSGYLDIAGCPSPADGSIAARDITYEAMVFAGGRIYQITLDGDVDRAYFGALLATVVLDPAHAIDQASGS